jgi:dephospho-CoA kinase
MSSQPPAPSVDRLVIGIAGRIGAGKTSAGLYLHSKHGFQYLRYSLVLTDWIMKDSKKKDVQSKTQLQTAGWKVMEGGMQAELNRRLIAQVQPRGRVAVDGLRHPTDFESLRNAFNPSFHLIYIESARVERWNHLRAHGRYADFSSFEAADSHPVEHHIELLRTHAERVVNNNRSLDALYIALDETILEFEKEDRI